jgi:hypothetical protein
MSQIRAQDRPMPRPHKPEECRCPRVGGYRTEIVSGITLLGQQVDRGTT